MIPAELQRYLLLAGLIVTGYLMMLAWNTDYGPSNQPVEVSEAPGVATSPAPVPSDAPPVAEEIASDVPDDSLIADTAEPVMRPSAGADAQVPTQRLVRVQTDALEVWIDTYGGDIVRAQLPQYRMTIDQPDVPFLLLDSGNGHTYVAQSGLLGPNGIDSTERPTFSVPQNDYQLQGENLAVTLVARIDGYDVKKTFTFERGSYLIDVAYEVGNRTAEPFQARLFAQIKRDTREPYGTSSFTLGPQPYLGGALTTIDNRYEKLDFEDLDESDFKATVPGGWIAMLQHYFLSAWIPEAADTNHFYGRKRPDGTYTYGVMSPLKEIAPSASGTYRAQFYAGPKDQKVLEQISPNLNLTVDYGWLWWLAVPLFYVLDWFHEYVNNWGVAIILLTVLVKILLYPLSAPASNRWRT